MAKEKVSQDLLDPKTVSQAEALGLQARFIVEGYMSGEHKSPYRGFAIEFTQHREYVPGDDIRHLDWKVLGRTDRYYLKQYEQETNYVGHILLDASESMKYGSAKTSKLHYGKQIAAVLAYLILLQRDAVGVEVFDAQVRHHIPRTGNMHSIHNIMGVLGALEGNGGTDIAGILHMMAGQIKRKGIVIIISDFFDDEAAILEGIQHIRFGGSEVIVFHVMDPYELEFPFKGMVEFDGLESKSRILTRPSEIRQSYLKEVRGFCDRIKEGCERNQCHYTLLDTSHSLTDALTGYLAFRRRTTV